MEEFIGEFLDARIEYIFNNSNGGFGAGHNVVIKRLIEGGSGSGISLDGKCGCFFLRKILLRKLLNI